MDAQIRISGGNDVAEFASLWQWLTGERALAGAARLVRAPPAGTELGAGSDLLAVALGSGGAGVALAKSLATWLRTRRADVAVTVTSRLGSVTVEARQVRDGDVLPILREVLGAHDEA